MKKADIDALLKDLEDASASLNEIVTKRLRHAIALHDVNEATELAKQARLEGLPLIDFLPSNGEVQRALVPWLLKAGADMNARNDFGMPPVQWAVMNDDAELLQVYIENGARLDADMASVEDKRHGRAHESPFRVAVIARREQCLITMLRCQPDLAKTTFDRGTFLHQILDAPFVPELVPLSDSCLEQKGTEGLIPAANAIARKLEERTIDVLLAASVERGHHLDDRNELLMMAATHGNAKAAKTLIHHGSNLSPRDAGAMTPLLRAAFEGHLDIVRLLVSAGVRQEFSRWGRGAIYHAAERGHTDIVRYLIDIGFPADERAGEDSDTPLDAALHCKDGEETALLLIESGANVNYQRRGRKGSGGLTLSPFHVAACRSSPRVVQAMLDAGAELGLLAIFDYGSPPMTALDMAIHRKNHAIVELLQSVYSGAHRVYRGAAN